MFDTRTRIPAALEVAPRLLGVPTAAESCLPEAISYQDAEVPWGVLISSPLKLRELTSRLCRRIDVTAEREGMMLRYWDSRVLLSLYGALDETTRGRFFAFGEQLLVSDRRGGSIVLEASCPTHDPVGAEPISLDRSDTLALGRASRIDAVLDLLRRDNPGGLEAIPHIERYELAKSQVAACLERDLCSPRDHALALSFAIEHGPGWWNEEVWKPVLEKAKQVTLLKAYTDLLELV